MKRCITILGSHRIHVKLVFKKKPDYFHVLLEHGCMKCCPSERVPIVRIDTLLKDLAHLAHIAAVSRFVEFGTLAECRTYDEGHGQNSKHSFHLLLLCKICM